MRGPPARRRASCGAPIPLVATPPAASASVCSGAPPNGSATGTGRVRPAVPPSRRSPAHSTATLARAGQPLREQVGEQALGQAAAVERDARRADDDAGRRVGGDLAPRPRLPPGRGAARQARAAARAGAGAACAGRAGSPAASSSRDERAVDEAARAPPGVGDGGGEQRELAADGHPPARVGVEPGELAVRVEARVAVVPREQLSPGALRPPRRAERPSPPACTEQVPPKQGKRAACSVMPAPPSRAPAASRTPSSAIAGAAVATSPSTNQVVPASVPMPSAWPIPSSQASAVKRCSVRQRATPIRARA